MVNQIVFVPERLFVRERKAIEEAKRMLDEFDRRFSESAHVGPGDPIEFLQRAIRESLVESPSTSTFVASMDKRERLPRNTHRGSGTMSCKAGMGETTKDADSADRPFQ
jgi:hypothetical protein